MSLEFKKLSEVTIVETVSDMANVLVEEEGIIKRVPKSEVGGGASGAVIFTIVSEDGASTTSDSPYSCNTSFIDLLEMYNGATLGNVLLNIIEPGMGINQKKTDTLCVATDSNGNWLDVGEAIEALCLFFQFSNTTEGFSASLYYLNDGTITDTAPFTPPAS